MEIMKTWILELYRDSLNVPCALDVQQVQAVTCFLEILVIEFVQGLSKVPCALG